MPAQGAAVEGIHDTALQFFIVSEPTAAFQPDDAIQQ
jgi:hypothetical protein